MPAFPYSYIKFKLDSKSFAESRAAAAAAAVSFRGKLPSLAAYGRASSRNASRGWISGALALPAAGIDYNISFA